MKITNTVINRLKKAHWTCTKCGPLYGTFPTGHVATFHYGKCDVCKATKVAVTESRDYGYFKKTLFKLIPIKPCQKKKKTIKSRSPLKS